mgnify:CR=1 FL=1|tara:strand:- start:48 stop:917 length:870 start_codon:yes stop_codon:yes gene_type:complete
MIVYTDLCNRTKNYTLTDEMVSMVENQCNVKITTIINPDAEVYWGDKITQQHLEVMPNLKWVHLSKTGIGKFNLPDNMLVTNTPDSSEGVAEYAVAGVLHLLRGLDRMSNNRLGFDKNIDYIKPFNQISCLIVGYGRIGKRILTLLNSLGMNIKYISRNNQDMFKYSDSITNCDISNFDFIINTLPLTPETNNYFTKKTFGKMNKSSYIINVGRGETINENDLINALETKQIRGAFLDVVQNEPISHDNPLLKLDNIFISPHIANAMCNALNTQVKVFIDKLIKYKKKI